MTNSIYLLSIFTQLKDRLASWNESANNFFSTYLSNPFAGYIIFGIIAVIMWIAIKGFASK